MRFLYLLSLIFVLITFLSSAQTLTNEDVEKKDEFEPYWKIGVNGGTNLSFANYSPSVFVGTLFGFHGGGVVQFVAQPNVGIQAELNFTQMGWTENPPADPGFVSGNGNAFYQKNLTFIEMPLMTHLVFGKKKVNYIFNIGFWGGYLIGESEITNNPFYENAINFSYANDHHRKPIDNPVQVGACVSPAIKYKTKFGEFQLEVRFVSVFTRNFDNSVEIVRTEIGEEIRRISFRNAQNQSLNVSFAYLYDVSRLFKKKKS
ncbi:MAG: porin family protein [Flammeovirgaceae bacterium]